MIQLNSIEISYFRSIHKLKLLNLADLVVLSGKNDIGKSNILKALNLFFNNETDWKTPFEFERDFSKKRLQEVRKKTIKGKQYVQIKLGFERGERYEGSLPKTFVFCRTWHRDSARPSESSSIKQQYQNGEIGAASLDRAQASVQRYLNTIRFEYVPAIKDQHIFAYLLGMLQDRIFDAREGKSDIGKALEGFNATVATEAGSLREEFERVSGIRADVRLPGQLSELFRAFAVATKAGDDEIPLNLRGDGIRSRFLPSLMHYISQRSNKHYIWGFEEPENSLEFALATKLAEQMAKEYSKETQIFVTSHSPAFFGMAADGSRVYRVYQDDGSTAAHPVALEGNKVSTTGPRLLEEELGLMAFQQQWQQEYERKVKSLELLHQSVRKTRDAIDREKRPVLLTEGKWDIAILQEAWKRLFGSGECPYRMLTCNPLPEAAEGGAAGVGTLKSCLETHRPDEPVAVGLFDRDVEGSAKGFMKLNANFKAMEDDADIAVQTSGAAAAILLPIITGREDYAKNHNLVMEYYFDDSHLETQVDGRGLRLVFPEIEQTLVGTGQKLQRVAATALHFRRIDPTSKKHFVERIVPALPEEAFANFAQLFKKVEKAIEEAVKRRSHSKGKGEERATPDPRTSQPAP